MPHFWDEKYLNALDDIELQQQLKEFRESMEDEWENEILKVLKVYSPEQFNLEVCTYEMYRRVSCFLSTRCFGWGLPTTLVVPIADSLNHSANSLTQVDLVNKRLHL